MRRLFALCLLLLLNLLAAAPGSAQVVIPDSDGDSAPLRIHSQKMRYQIQDRVARLEIEQEFAHNGNKAVDGTYILPLPRDATITGFRYWVKGREVVAKLLPRDEAEQKQAKAVARGRAAALVDQIDKISFRCRISPLLPDSLTRVRMDMIQALPCNRAEVTLLAPLRVLGLNYQITHLSISVDGADQLPIDRISSPSHPNEVKISKKGTNGFHAELKGDASDKEPLFKLSYRLKAEGMGATLLTYRKRGEPGYFLLQLAPTSRDTREVQLQRDVVFVIDQSGSMAGEKIEQAKRALLLGIEGLRPGDRFGMVSYSNDVYLFRKQLEPFNESLQSEAVQWANPLHSLSGTNLHDALIAGLKLFESNDRMKVLVFLTDGLPTVGVTDKEAILKNVTEANTLRSRIYSWAFGKDADDGLLTRISQQNYASAEHYYADDVIEAKMRAFYQRAGQPILLDTAIDYGTKVTDAVPNRLPDLYHGLSLAIVGRYDDGAERSLALRGKRGAEAFTEQLPLTLPDEDLRHPFIAQLWARQRAADLVKNVQANGEKSSVVEEVVRLSRKHSILTPYTAFFVEAPQEDLASRGQEAAPAMAGQTQFAVAGDPRIVVHAPAGTQSVAALFPWGDRLDLNSEGNGRWTGRFIVPPGTQHGHYTVRIAILGARGAVTWREVYFTAAVNSPQGTVESGFERKNGGWLISTTVRVGPGVAKAFLVVKGVGAVTLKRIAGREYFGQLFVPAGSGPVSVVLLDAAHNRTILPVKKP